MKEVTNNWRKGTKNVTCVMKLFVKKRNNREEKVKERREKE
jgi:hypothetical protein